MTTVSENKWESLIAKALPHHESRPQQIEMAEAVSSAMANHRHLMVEAGTGVGKSFAYLLPAIDRILSHDERVVIATHTINLQEQLVEKDIPALRNVFGAPFKAVLVKGRNNYIGLRRLMQTSRRQSAIFSNPKALKQLHQVEDWAYDTHDGSLSDIEFQPLPEVWSRVRSESNNCMGSRCEFYDKCFYQRARRQAEGAQLLIVNHALFFADLALRRHDVTFLPDYDHVIFDEAHNIESVAGDHMGMSVSNIQLHTLLRGIFNERWLFGQLTTSIYSNADLVANYEGYLFYRSLFEDGIVRGKPAIVHFTGDRAVLRRAFSWGDHVNDYWDEALNPSHMSPEMAASMQRAILQVCPDYERAPEAFRVRDEPELRRRYSAIGLKAAPENSVPVICAAAAAANSGS